MAKSDHSLPGGFLIWLENRTERVFPAPRDHPDQQPRVAGAGAFQEESAGRNSHFRFGGLIHFQQQFTGREYMARLLEKKLRRKFGPAIRVVNGGTPGYTSYQSFLRLNCQIIQYAPDMVLIYHLWNDIKYFANSDIPALVQKLEAHGRFKEHTTLNFFAGNIPVFDWLTGVSQIAARLRFALLKLVRHLNKVDDEGTTRESLQETIQPAALDFYRGNLLSMRNLLAEKTSLSSSSSKGPFSVLRIPKGKSGRSDTITPASVGPFIVRHTGWARKSTTRSAACRGWNAYPPTRTSPRTWNISGIMFTSRTGGGSGLSR